MKGLTAFVIRAVILVALLAGALWFGRDRLRAATDALLNPGPLKFTQGPPQVSVQKLGELVTLNVSYPGGSAYMCIMGGECGVHGGLKGKDRGPSPFVEVFPTPDAGGYSGVFYLGGAVTASPPVHHKGPVKILDLPQH